MERIMKKEKKLVCRAFVGGKLEKKGVMLVFEDETTITQKPCIRKSMSLEE